MQMKKSLVFPRCPDGGKALVYGSEIVEIGLQGLIDAPRGLFRRVPYADIWREREKLYH